MLWVSAAETPPDRNIINSSSAGRNTGGDGDYFERRPFLDSANLHISELGLDTTWARATESDRWASWEELKGLRLTPNMEQIAWLYYMDGMRVRDIALYLGITSKAVDKRRRIMREHVGSRLSRRAVWCKISEIFNPDDGVLFFVAKKYFDEMLSYREVCSETLVCVDEVIKIIKNFIERVEAETGEVVCDTSSKYRRAMAAISPPEVFDVCDPDGQA